MSTFNGLVAEFPDIRVDYFRSHPGRPFLAGFVSHIHQDHLAGLESLRSPFIYCSAATREMLLRLERYPCRINYAHGVLEARVQRYRHLKNLLKPIPLETPTVLELEPGSSIQVTLFDANHCPGAVMFLFEGRGKAVLYTGDIRSEPWFVNAIARSPSLIEYSSGLKTLDTIYLDTSFIDKGLEFPTKRQGITELLQKVSRYPADTIFHFQAWTYGYEDVWLALSKTLKSKIHVDEYKMLMFSSLLSTDPNNKFAPSLHLSPEAPGLVGFMCGNTYHPGCLTRDEDVRLHSCEKGNYCAVVKNSPVVWIRPIITRLPDGQDVAEVGVGGGGHDLEREAELDYLSPDDAEGLLEMLCNVDAIAAELREQVHRFLISTIVNGRRVPLNLDRGTFGENNETDLVKGLQAITGKLKLHDERNQAETEASRALPSVITFPYSRHSSYHELCDLLRLLQPRDVWPCTVDVERWLREGITVEDLFSDCCSGDVFRHDELMRKQFAQHASTMSGGIDSQLTGNNVPQLSAIPTGSPELGNDSLLTSPGRRNQTQVACNQGLEHHPTEDVLVVAREPPDPCKVWNESACLEELASANTEDSQNSAVSLFAFETRIHAFEAMLKKAHGLDDSEIGLLSVRDNHSKREDELSSAERR